MTVVIPDVVVIQQEGTRSHKIEVKIYVDNPEIDDLALSQIAPDRIFSAL